MLFVYHVFLDLVWFLEVFNRFLIVFPLVVDCFRRLNQGLFDFLLEFVDLAFSLSNLLIQMIDFVGIVFLSWFILIVQVLEFGVERVYFLRQRIVVLGELGKFVLEFFQFVLVWLKIGTVLQFLFLNQIRFVQNLKLIGR